MTTKVENGEGSGCIHLCHTHFLSSGLLFGMSSTALATKKSSASKRDFSFFDLCSFHGILKKDTELLVRSFGPSAKRLVSWFDADFLIPVSENSWFQ